MEMEIEIEIEEEIEIETEIEIEIEFESFKISELKIWWLYNSGSHYISSKFRMISRSIDRPIVFGSLLDRFVSFSDRFGLFSNRFRKSLPLKKVQIAIGQGWGRTAWFRSEVSPARAQTNGAIRKRSEYNPKQSENDLDRSETIPKRSTDRPIGRNLQSGDFQMTPKRIPNNLRTPLKNLRTNPERP